MQQTGEKSWLDIQYELQNLCTAQFWLRLGFVIIIAGLVVIGRLPSPTLLRFSIVILLILNLGPF